MAKRKRSKRSFGSTGPQHRQQAGSASRLMRLAAKDVREALHDGDCRTALRAFSRFSVWVGHVHAHRSSMGIKHNVKRHGRVTGELKTRASLVTKITKQCMR